MMKVLAILSVLCLAHFGSARTFRNIDQDFMGLGGDVDDLNKFVTKNIRAKNIDNMNVLNDDDRTVNVMEICKKIGFNDMDNLDLMDKRDDYTRKYRNDLDNNDCLVLHIKGKKKHMNHDVVVVVKDTDADHEIRNNNLNDDNVVFVTVHKKLGTVTRNDINDDDVLGRVDVKDLIGALKWIRKNIHKFGGDCDRVVLVCDHTTTGIVNALKNTHYYGYLFKDIMHQTGTDFDRNMDDDKFYKNRRFGGDTYGMNKGWGSFMNKQNRYNTMDDFDLNKNWRMSTLRYKNMNFGGRNDFDDIMGRDTMNYRTGYNKNMWNNLGMRTFGGMDNNYLRMKDIRCRQLGDC